MIRIRDFNIKHTSFWRGGLLSYRIRLWGLLSLCGFGPGGLRPRGLMSVSRPKLVPHHCGMYFILQHFTGFFVWNSHQLSVQQITEYTCTVWWLVSLGLHQTLLYSSHQGVGVIRRWRCSRLSILCFLLLGSRRPCCPCWRWLDVADLCCWFNIRRPDTDDDVVSSCTVLRGCHWRRYRCWWRHAADVRRSIMNWFIRCLILSLCLLPHEHAQTRSNTNTETCWSVWKNIDPKTRKRWLGSEIELWTSENIYLFHYTLILRFVTLFSMYSVQW